MSRQNERLKAVSLGKLAKTPGLHADGRGLYLRVAKPPSTATSWVLRYMLNRRAHELGLGPYPEIGLAEARDKAMELRRLKANGVDPLHARRSDRAKGALEAAKNKTFREVASEYLDAHNAAWKNEKHRDQWTATLEAYAFPTIGSLPVSLIDAGLVANALKPIWLTKCETASRVRQRIETIWGFAKASGYVAGDNPADLKGPLGRLLGKQPSKAKRVQHHAALPYADVPGFMEELRSQGGVAARALELTIICATRTSETLNAKWDEFELEAGVWTIPAARMKNGREHRVPLTKPALALLAQLREEVGGDGYVFEGQKRGQPLSNMSLLAVLKRMKRNVTTHGFRASFRNWCAEKTSFPHAACEAALSHYESDGTVKAYLRTDHFEARTKLMAVWAGFCSSPVN